MVDLKNVVPRLEWKGSKGPPLLEAGLCDAGWRSFVNERLKRINDILDVLKVSPTVLDPEVEMSLCGRVMDLTDEELVDARPELRFILGELYISHVDNGFMLRDSTSDYARFFHTFSEWLNRQNVTLSLGIPADVLKEFAMTSHDIERYFS